MGSGSIWLDYSMLAVVLLEPTFEVLIQKAESGSFFKTILVVKVAVALLKITNSDTKR